MKVFLGGTCNGSMWRSLAIKYFNDLNIDYFNPIVDDWDDAARQNELKQREECDIVLYCITPKMSGVYSIAEAVDDSNKQPQKTVFVVLNVDSDSSFDKHQLKSLNATGRLIEENGGLFFSSLQDAAISISKISLNIKDEFQRRVSTN